MYKGTYAPWDHYPKTLRLAEIQDPISVITEFFNASGIGRHRQDLKDWRDRVISDEYYDDEPHGPGTLIFIYELNLKLLEAAYLKLLQYLENKWQIEIIEDKQLTEEKAAWIYFPDNISVEEMRNPYLSIERIFKEITPQMYRDYLREWLEAALSTRQADEVLMPGEVINVYEHMLTLYAACWIICQRETGPTDLNKIPTSNCTTEIICKYSKTKTIRSDPTAAEKLALEFIKMHILKSFPFVDMIIHIGTHPEPYTFFLLILIKDKEKIMEGGLGDQIESACTKFANIHTIIHKTTTAKQGLNAGNKFWTTAIKKGNVIFKEPEGELPNPHELTIEETTEHARIQWEHWSKLGTDFLAGAGYYLSTENYKLAAFLLHQSTESTLKALINAILGYPVQIHNLSKLIRLSLLICDDLSNVFKAEDPEVFALLQRSYVQARYSNSFYPDKQEVTILEKTVRKFTQIAERTFNSYISDVANNTI